MKPSFHFAICIACWLTFVPAIAQAQQGTSGDRCEQSPPSRTATVVNDRGEKETKSRPMYYCFDSVRGVPTIWLVGSVSWKTSAAAVLPGLRQTHRYRQVLLNSPGGNVADAFVIGGELKRLRATVRIPNHPDVYCVSACTMLMLGGYNRIVEEGATFLIHAKSAVMEVYADKRLGPNLTWADVVRIARERPDEWVSFVEDWYSGERKSSVEYTVFLQDVLGGTPNLPLYEQLASEPLLPRVYERAAATARNLDRDVAALSSDGVVAVQEILTQVELDAMRKMLSRMRAREAELGRGAKVALRIFEANLACRIQDVCALSRHQLANLGYHNFDER